MPTAAKSKKIAPKRPQSTKKVKSTASNDKEIGSLVKSFSLPATVVGKVSSASLKGKPYILYFYPKDDTPGCTIEACAFRDAMPNFSKLGITVIGVSRDSIASHEKFAKKFRLSFPLASDESGNLCAQFGVWKEKSMYGRNYMGIERSTFLVDGKGVMRAVWRKVNVPGHADEVKKAISEL